ncbi:hypothetical protein CPB84DRAFT_1873291 [Gymnopilus junonius]|uniref:Uncharacterized protein n=1 Tax=Gymnopilus junonius TaxID=109634 RepID=A0A9P5NG06_GYMJU|nr:hypothetical protein CPB84DRAFT_1873291 [Gymnopilus junonius]
MVIGKKGAFVDYSEMAVLQDCELLVAIWHGRLRDCDLENAGPGRDPTGIPGFQPSDFQGAKPCTIPSILKSGTLSATTVLPGGRASGPADCPQHHTLTGHIQFMYREQREFLRMPIVERDPKKVKVLQRAFLDKWLNSLCRHIPLELLGSGIPVFKPALKNARVVSKPALRVLGHYVSSGGPLRDTEPDPQISHFVHGIQMRRDSFEQQQAALKQVTVIRGVVPKFNHFRSTRFCNTKYASTRQDLLLHCRTIVYGQIFVAEETRFSVFLFHFDPDDIQIGAQYTAFPSTHSGIVKEPILRGWVSRNQTCTVDHHKVFGRNTLRPLFTGSRTSTTFQPSRSRDHGYIIIQIIQSMRLSSEIQGSAMADVHITRKENIFPAAVKASFVTVTCDTLTHRRCVELCTVVDAV